MNFFGGKVQIEQEQGEDRQTDMNRDMCIVHITVNSSLYVLMNAELYAMVYVCFLLGAIHIRRPRKRPNFQPHPPYIVLSPSPKSEIPDPLPKKMSD